MYNYISLKTCIFMTPNIPPSQGVRLNLFRIRNRITAIAIALATTGCLLACTNQAPTPAAQNTAPPVPPAQPSATVPTTPAQTAPIEVPQRVGVVQHVKNTVDVLDAGRGAAGDFLKNNVVPPATPVTTSVPQTVAESGAADTFVDYCKQEAHSQEPNCNVP
jgi:hypothetical protein